MKEKQNPMITFLQMLFALYLPDEEKSQNTQIIPIPKDFSSLYNKQLLIGFEIVPSKYDVDDKTAMLYNVTENIHTDLKEEISKSYIALCKNENGFESSWIVNIPKELSKISLLEGMIKNMDKLIDG